MERDRFEELARTLGLQEADLGVMHTIRRGTLLAPRTDGVTSALDETSTLPRLQVAAPDASDEPDADLALVSLLGRGGMGAVWLAHQRSLDRSVAVKRSVGEGWTPDDSAALLAEGRATGALEHPSIVPVHALGVDADGSPLLVMKRVEGATLDALLADCAHPAWPDLLRRYGDRHGVIVEILMRVADALHFAHAREFVHRDVKPANVMVGAFGETYLLDWGLAVRTSAIDPADKARVSLVGTPAFMAPEMVRGEVELVDARTDVYLLGATLHAALTGRPRHGGSTLGAALHAAMISEPVRYGSEVPAELAALANASTRRDPSERPASALAFRDALADFVRHRSSLRLAERASASLAASADPTEGARALAEARFGFAQALREWDANETARAGLRTTLRRLAEAELERRSPEAASALAREIAPPDTELDARIEALRDEVAEGRRLEDAARTEARERDPTITAGPRSLVAGLVTVLVVAATALAGLRQFETGEEPSMSMAMSADLGMLAIGLAAIAFFRRKLLSNRWGRQTTGFIVLMLFLPPLCSLLTILRGGTFRGDMPYRMLAFVVGFSVAALTISPRLGWAALPMVAGAVLATWDPMLAMPMQALTAGAATWALIAASRARQLPS